MEDNKGKPQPAKKVITKPETPSSKKIKAVSSEVQPECFYCNKPMEKIYTFKRRWVCEICILILEADL